MGSSLRDMTRVMSGVQEMFQDSCRLSGQSPRHASILRSMVDSTRVEAEASPPKAMPGI